MCVYAFVCVYMYVCVYVCMFVCVYQMKNGCVKPIPCDVFSCCILLLSCIGPVQSLTVTSVNATAITLRWDAPLFKTSSVTEYRVEYRVQSESLLGNATITDPTQTAYAVVDLTPGTSYQLRVVPVNSIGDGPPISANARTGA